MSSLSEPARAAAAVDERRLWSRHEEMGKIGATAKGGVNRQALSREDAAARQLMIDWARELDLEVATDAIGNLFIHLRGTTDREGPGSHGQSPRQPTDRWPFRRRVRCPGRP